MVHVYNIPYDAFSGRTDVKAEAPILWPPDEKSRLIGKDPVVQIYIYMHIHHARKSLRSCLTLCDLMDYSL